MPPLPGFLPAGQRESHASPWPRAFVMGWAWGIPLLVFAAAWWLTGRVLAWLQRRAILDRPVERSSHRVPVPRGGGLALVPVLVIAWLALAALGDAPAGTAGIAVLAAALAFLSWLDDLRGLPVQLRLPLHLVAVLIGVVLLPAGVFQGLLPPLLDSAASALLWLWFVELFNFMDGIDGISGIETAALGSGMALAALAGDASLEQSILPALTLAAAGLAFLRWNWHPARIFLGDVGSVSLGYLLGWLLLGLAVRGWWAPALILPLYYFADATLTLARRLLRGERVWEAHRQHFYQRALAPDGDHAAVARMVAAGDAALIVAALVAARWPAAGLALAAIVVIVLLVALERRARRS
jgi:UDP-N-acetylmuramyl pentapeptide phosphotransferase/UDP-N-acetylglucosamine-1-phosphate transferase